MIRSSPAIGATAAPIATPAIAVALPSVAVIIALPGAAVERTRMPPERRPAGIVTLAGAAMSGEDDAIVTATPPGPAGVASRTWRTAVPPLGAMVID